MRPVDDGGEKMKCDYDDCGKKCIVHKNSKTTLCLCKEHLFLLYDDLHNRIMDLLVKEEKR